MVSLLSLNAFDLALTEKLLVGSLFGTLNLQLCLPILLDLDRCRRLNRDEFVTRTHRLDDDIDIVHLTRL